MGAVAGDVVSPAVVVGDHAGVAVSGGNGDVAFGLAGVESHGDEGVPERVGCDAFGDAGVAGDKCDGAGGAAAVQLGVVAGDEQGTFGSFTMAVLTAQAVRCDMGMVWTFPPLRER